MKALKGHISPLDASIAESAMELSEAQAERDGVALELMETKAVAWQLMGAVVPKTEVGAQRGPPLNVMAIGELEDSKSNVVEVPTLCKDIAVDGQALPKLMEKPKKSGGAKVKPEGACRSTWGRLAWRSAALAPSRARSSPRASP